MSQNYFNCDRKFTDCKGCDKKITQEKNKADSKAHMPPSHRNEETACTGWDNISSAIHYLYISTTCVSFQSIITLTDWQSACLKTPSRSIILFTKVEVQVL